MTFSEKLKIERPEMAEFDASSIARGCPYHYGYEPATNRGNICSTHICEDCWNREIPETEPTKNEREENKMEPRFCSTAIANEEREPKLCDRLMDLYHTLAEIEQMTNRLGTTLFGIPASEVAVGCPECMESNVQLAVEMAKLIREELCVLTGRLGG